MLVYLKIWTALNQTWVIHVYEMILILIKSCKSLKIWKMWKLSVIVFFFYNLFFFFLPCSGRNWKPPNLINCQIHKRLINWYIERDDVQDYLAYLVVSDIINLTDQIKQSQRPIFIFVCLSVLNIKCITYSKNFFFIILYLKYTIVVGRS